MADDRADRLAELEDARQQLEANARIIDQRLAEIAREVEELLRPHLVRRTGCALRVTPINWRTKHEG